jgi:sugar lactone lactonase YvrE
MMFKKIMLGSVLILLGSLIVGPVMLYLVSPVEPVSWQPDPKFKLEGPFAKNIKLDEVELIAAGALPEAEDITFDQNGWLYTGLNDGRIVKLHPDNPSHIVDVTNTQGRPLGLRFDATGNLIVADTERGLISVAPNGDIDVLVDYFEGRKLLLVDHLDIAANGDIYFSDASAKFGLDNHLLDFIEASSTGAVYKYSVDTGRTTLLLDSLFFSNGVALGPNDEYLLVAETGRARILKYHLSGPKQGQTEIFINELPAMPDNLFYDEDGTVWVGLIALRDWRVDMLAAYPTLRRIIGALPIKWLKPTTSYGFAIGIDVDGNVTHNLQTPTAFTNITAVIKQNNKLYLGSLMGDSVAVYDL